MREPPQPFIRCHLFNRFFGLTEILLNFRQVNATRWERLDDRFIRPVKINSFECLFKLVELSNVLAQNVIDVTEPYEVAHVAQLIAQITPSALNAVHLQWFALVLD